MRDGGAYGCVVHVPNVLAALSGTFAECTGSICSENACPFKN